MFTHPSLFYRAPLIGCSRPTILAILYFIYFLLFIWSIKLLYLFQGDVFNFIAMSIIIGNVVGQPIQLLAKSGGQMTQPNPINIIPATCSTDSILFHHKEKSVQDENRSLLKCNDLSSPCKCDARRSRFVTTRGEVHYYTEHICSKNQDGELFKKLLDAGIRMECSQLESTIACPHCIRENKRVATYKVGCELRFIIDPFAMFK